MLSKHYWIRKTFWSDSYFACSIGEVSSATIQSYIETQGQKGVWHSSHHRKVMGFCATKIYEQDIDLWLPNAALPGQFNDLTPESKRWESYREDLIKRYLTK